MSDAAPAAPAPGPATAGAAETSLSAAAAVHRIERALDRLFGAEANPLRHLGALGFLLFWIVVASGIYVYPFHETSVAGSHASVAAMLSGAPPGSGLMHSLHRYASGALVAIVALHVAREMALGRFRGFRWFTWLSGVPLPWLLVACGIVGYWLVWDELGAFTALATLELFAALPALGDSTVRNAIIKANLTDRLFSLLMFLHIALALALLLGMWVHVQRLAHPVTRPPRSVGFPIALALLALALLVPAPLHESGDPTRVGATLAFDWFFLAALPLAVAAPVATWFALALVTSALGLLPWLWLAPRHGLVRADTATGTGATAPLAWSAPARVDPDHCNGCGLCVADCPYGALVLAAVPDAGRRRPRALVRESMCASCGICAGSCPSATPLRGPVISSGIDLPDAPLQALRDALVSGLAKMRGSGTSSRPNADMVVAFVCEHGARPPASDRVLALPLRCAAQLPPSFVELALREGAGGVVVSRCAAGDCEFRLGARWVGMRIAAQREPRLRANVPAGRLMLVDASPGDEALLARELTAIAARASADVRAGNAGAPEQTNG